MWKYGCVSVSCSNNLHVDAKVLMSRNLLKKKGIKFWWNGGCSACLLINRENRVEFFQREWRTKKQKKRKLCRGRREKKRIGCAVLKNIKSTNRLLLFSSLNTIIFVKFMHSFGARGGNRLSLFVGLCVSRGVKTTDFGSHTPSLSLALPLSRSISHSAGALTKKLLWHGISTIFTCLIYDFHITRHQSVCRVRRTSFHENVNLFAFFLYLVDDEE